MALESQPIRLSKPNLAAAAKLLSEAFANDPFVKTLHPNPETRLHHFAKTTMCVLRYGEACGEVQAVSPNMEGVAVWLPPDRAAASVCDIIRSGMLSLPFTIGIRSTRIAMAYTDHTVKMRERHMRGPFWYLQILGVHPSHRGAGHGAFLLRSMLKRLDSEGVPCCLDTENEKNLAMYEHFGFRVQEASEIPSCGCPVWLMARDVHAGDL